MNARTTLAREIMTEFAHLSGLQPAATPPRRYLWTDAFAVCNLLGMWQETRDGQFKDLALGLVDQVHATLGQYRRDDTRAGWISGLDGEAARLHPTAGGLRIGKQLKERRKTEPLDERLEWDRDGQYFHYLTKWMHALNCATRVTGDFTYNRWAVELARAAHGRFTYRPSSGGPKRMYWKMSTDLSYPLVQSMGLHDPLDGLITYIQLGATAARGQEPSAGLGLEAEIADMTDMCKGRNWFTDDPLGIGSLLSDAFRVAELITSGSFSRSDLLVNLLETSLQGLEAFDGDDQLRLPADHRLAFRELGLSIGLRALQRLPGFVRERRSLFAEENDLKDRLAALQRYGRLAEVIESFWLAPENRGETWMAHQDINMVMLATSLSPGGYLTV
jgi:hypothetical protein